MLLPVETERFRLTLVPRVPAISVCIVLILHHILQGELNGKSKGHEIYTDEIFTHHIRDINITNRLDFVQSRFVLDCTTQHSCGRVALNVV